MTASRGRMWIASAVSVILVLLLFRKVDVRQVAAAFRGMDLRYLAGAVGATLASYWFRSWRWSILLMPLRPVSPSRLFPPTVIGYMGNNLLPARLGELMRVWAAAGRERLQFGETLATLVADRLLDGISLLVMLAIVLLAVTLPAGNEALQSSLTAAGLSSVALYAAVALFLVFLKVRPTAALGLLRRLLRLLPTKIASKIDGGAASFVQGVALPSPGDAGHLIASCVVIWFFSWLPLELTCRAFSLELPPGGSLLVLVLLVFAVMVPASPGYVGTFHAACVFGLSLFGVDRDRSLSVALVAHAMNFIPVTLLGLYFLWREKLSFAGFRTLAERRENG